MQVDDWVRGMDGLPPAVRKSERVYDHVAYRHTVGRRSFPVAASILFDKLTSAYSVIRLPDRLLPQTKDILVLPIIPRHFAVTIYISTSLSWTL